MVVGALPDAIKGSLGIVDIYFLACKLIGASGGNNHPHHVVVKVVAIPFIGIFIHQMQPIGAHLFLEVIVYRGEGIEILLLARGFVGVEHGFKNLGFAPSALGKGFATTHGLKERSEVVLAHLIAQSVGKGGDRSFFNKGPRLLCSIVARLLNAQCQLGAITCINGTEVTQLCTYGLGHTIGVCAGINGLKGPLRRCGRGLIRLLGYR